MTVLKRIPVAGRYISDELRPTSELGQPTGEGPRYQGAEQPRADAPATDVRVGSGLLDVRHLRSFLASQPDAREPATILRKVSALRSFYLFQPGEHHAPDLSAVRKQRKLVNYRDVIVDHNRNPRNFRPMPDADRHAEGFNPLCGDRVALYMQNCPQFVAAFYGILRADAVVVPVNPMNKADEFGHYIADSGARICITSADLAGTVAEADARLPPAQRLHRLDLSLPAGATVADALRIALARRGRSVPADIVVANILANPLVQLAPLLASGIARGGRIALAGLAMSAEREFDVVVVDCMLLAAMAAAGRAMVSGVRRPSASQYAWRSASFSSAFTR